MARFHSRVPRSGTRRRFARVGLCALIAFVAVPIVLTTTPAGSLGAQTATLNLSTRATTPGQTVVGTFPTVSWGMPPYGVPVTFATSGDVHIAPATCTTDSHGQCYIEIT